MISKVKLAFIVISTLLPSVIVFGQIITGSFNSRIPCCSSFPLYYPYFDTFDFDNDAICEFRIEAAYSVDSKGFQARACNNVQLNEATLYGNSFPRNKWNWYGTGVPHTVLLDNWGDWWLPNTGVKYLGFRRINAPADTTYGWVKMDFKEFQPGNVDTLYVLDYAYNEIPNTHLFAGQTPLTSTSNLEDVISFNFFPNPARDYIEFYNSSDLNIKIDFLDMNGMKVKSENAERQSTGLTDLSNINPGVYLLNVTDEKAHRIFRLIKL